MKKNMQFCLTAQKISFKSINPLFSLGKVHLLYTGENRNGSYLDKEDVDRCTPSLFGVPIVGEYIESIDNFGEHGQKIEVKDGELSIVSSTRPYGFVPNEAEVYWEEVEEDDGTFREYLVVDGVVLWTGRYSELENLLEQPFNQSIEIVATSTESIEIDEKEFFKIKDFYFSALCILGVDKNGVGHQEPAFESARILAYNLAQEKFKNEFGIMLEQFKQSINQDQGGKDLTLNKDIEEEENKEGENNEKDSHFSLTIAQLTEALDRAISKIYFEDSWGDKIRKYWYVDSTESYVVVEDIEDSYQLYSIPFKKHEDSVEVLFDEKYKVKIEFTPYNDGLFTLYDSEKNKKEFALLKEENQALNNFKREVEETQIAAEFSSVLEEEEISKAILEYKNCSICQVREKLFVLVGMKNFKNNKLDFSLENEIDENKAPIHTEKTKEDKNIIENFFG